ncbi:MAG TPA: AAA family ATPase [Candidatus Deferrimicrobiaceae bacterium]|nr:AAA family ATPase [Candidatus Deferrimicrobiaceae bacterium]
MRKWMRDRLQRRKKTPATPSDKPAPPPLQPAYFEAEQAPDADERENVESEASAPPPFSAEDRPPQQGRAVEERPDRVADAGAEESPEESDRVASRAAPRSSEPGGRSRRRRGGRGRGGRGREQAVAQAFAPAAVKGSIPALSLEGAEEEMPEAGGEVTEKESEGQPVAVAAPKSPAPAAVAQRPPKGVVVLAIGLPGSGKSSWFKRHNVVPLSSDIVRALLFDDVREQRFQDLVFSNLRSMLKARLIAKRPTNYVDATNLTPQERQHWIKLAKDYHYEVHAVFFDVPLEVCIERHERRDRVVPEDVMRRMAAKLKPPTFEEGFAKITVVRVKKKESEAS